MVQFMVAEKFAKVLQFAVHPDIEKKGRENGPVYGGGKGRESAAALGFEWSGQIWWARAGV